MYLSSDTATRWMFWGPHVECGMVGKTHGYDYGCIFVDFPSFPRAPAGGLHLPHISINTIYYSGLTTLSFPFSFKTFKIITKLSS